MRAFVGLCGILLPCVVVAFDMTKITANRPHSSSWSRTQCGGPTGTADLVTEWGKTVTAAATPLPNYPRPALVRTTYNNIKNSDSAMQNKRERQQEALMPTMAVGGGSSGRGGVDLTKLRDFGDIFTWANLNGLWEWEPASAEYSLKNPPFGKTLNSSILVPFAVESCLSGVAPRKSADVVTEMWYRLVINIPVECFDESGKVREGKRFMLRFGAVDWNTTVFINQNNVGFHLGGFTEFEFEITADASPTTEILIHVFDPSDQGAQPNGKQRISAIDSPGGDTYSPVSGIWQTVWLEAVPEEFIHGISIETTKTSVFVNVDLGDQSTAGPLVDIAVMDGDKVIATAQGLTNTNISLTISSPKLWSPSSPFLYNISASLHYSNDVVYSYFGLREFAMQKLDVNVPPTGPQDNIDRPGSDLPGSPFALTVADPLFCWAACNKTAGCEAWAYGKPGCDSYTQPMCWLKSSRPSTSENKCRVSGAQGRTSVQHTYLNGNPIFLAGWLDQSWWPDGQYTAPTEDALVFDLDAVSVFGLNMVRLHQKVNPQRWYYHADTHGIIVYQDAVQKYGGATSETIPFFIQDLKEMIRTRRNHPSIVQWEVFNEDDCWKVFNQEPNTVQDMVNLARSLDNYQRPVDCDSGGGANGGSQNNGDVNDIHTYPFPGFADPSETMYGMVGEFGGIGAFVSGKEWVPNKCYGYIHVDTPHDQANLYLNMTAMITESLPFVSATVYTQITDVELECDGFYNYDRTNKFTDADTQAIAKANRALIASLAG